MLCRFQVAVAMAVACACRPIHRILAFSYELGSIYIILQL